MRAEALLAAAGAGTGQPALEALHATTRVDQLLLAGVERMAVGADLHVHVALGGTRNELVPAGAAHGGLCVLGMDVGLHNSYQCRSADNLEGVVVLVGLVDLGVGV